MHNRQYTLGQARGARMKTLLSMITIASITEAAVPGIPRTDNLPNGFSPLVNSNDFPQTAIQTPRTAWKARASTTLMFD